MPLPVDECAVVTMAACGAVVIPGLLVYLIGRVASSLFNYASLVHDWKEG